ncbi:tudor domain-containing protein 7 isoform X2 [Drosophila biarmipes]|uniref:tudor domain-containing protein 7 isoform X2 n=1 Tax=Drosophila biarmipes TaxID=125945 RepID=UPI0021CCC575|nr:tudor domain-containing protein 7 isoform X2 [Drosophila biarmipes]
MDDRGVLSLVKKVVHSLVVSSPGRMTIEKLMRDYRSEEGCNVPYLQLGFQDAESFLRSIPDTVKVMGHGSMALITAVTTDKSAHIQKLVHGQKKPTGRSRNRHKPKYCYASEQSDLVFINESVRKMSSKYVPPRTYQQPVKHHIPVSYPNYNRLLYSGHTPIIVYENIDAMIRAGQQQNNPRPRAHNFTQNAKPAPSNVLNQTQNVPKVEPPKKQNRQQQNFSRPQTPVENKQQNPPQELKNETEELVEAFENLSVIPAPPTGYQDNQEYEIYETDEEKFVKDPFSSGEEEQAPVIEIKDSEEENEAVVPDFEPLSEFKANPSPTSGILKNIDKLREPQESFYDYESSDDGDDENAIPAYAVDERVLGLDYPTDSVRFDFKLPERDIRTIIQLEERIEVQLVKMDNPHSFNFWIYNEEYDDLKALTANMQMFYESRDSEKYTMPLCLITTDHLCVVRHNISGVWERAKVVSYRPNNTRMTIEVELVDTGNFMCVSHKDVKFLLKEFAVLPAQVLAGRLAYITQLTAPVWSAEAVKFFYNMSSYRRLYAQVEAIQNNTAYLVLIDPDAVPVINLNKSLIDSGWVLRSITA